MKLFTLPTLLLIAAAIAWPLRAIPTTSISSVGGAERLTNGADLFALDSWDAASGILAYQVAEEEPRWLGVDAEAGTLAASEPPLRAAEVERVTVQVEGMWHRLLLDGELLWETEEEILGRPALSPDGSWLVVTRYPHGSSTAPLGELWRYDIAAQRWTPLTRNDVEEMTPRPRRFAWRTTPTTAAAMCRKGISPSLPLKSTSSAWCLTKFPLPRILRC